MRYISLFSGIEAASVAWRDLDGWEPVAFSEIDKFPSAVLAYRFPNVPNLGDITKIDWSEVIAEHGAVDLIVGGSPCQSFSIAAGANRTSLDGKSNLMLEWLRAVESITPKWVIWENVPGVLNTRDNAFGQLLRALQQIGYRDIAYGVLDAQFFGVAQRRRRVFLVGRFAKSGFCSAAVLFDSESVRGPITSNRDKRQSLITRNHGRIADSRAISLKTDHLTQNGSLESIEISPTLDVASSPPVVCITNDTSHAAVDNNLCGTLLAGGGSPPIVLKTRCGASTYIKRDGSIGTAGKGALIERDVTFTLATTQDMTLFDICDGEYMPPRRLTPIEYERLQGFPDNWTLIPYRDKPAEECPDGPRYKALGNSMAVPVMKWLGERIQMVDEIIEEINNERRN